MKLLITGASGYIGTRLVALAQSENHEVVAATRRPCRDAVEWLAFNLDSRVPLTIPDDVDAVIHLAANTSANSDEEDREVAAATMLLAATREAGARFLFVSSQTARCDAPTSYGRVKWAIELRVLTAGGLVIRPGQVYGGAERGLFGTLVRLVRTLPLLPVFLPHPMVQPIHVDDCARALLRLSTLPIIGPRVYRIGSREAVSFTAFLKAIARYRVRRFKLFVPVPGIVVRGLIHALGARTSARLGLLGLHSLFDLPLMDSSADLTEIGLELRPLAAGMNRSGDDRRRALLREGISFLTYVLRRRPGAAIVRRYVRVIEHLRAGLPLPLPRRALQHPWTLALMEDRSTQSSDSTTEFSWRIDAATVIAEASIQGADRFLGNPQRSRPLNALLQMSCAVGSELLTRLLRAAVPPAMTASRRGRRW